MVLVPLMDLWLPIVLAAVLVWIAAALFWTVSPHHKTDWIALPDENGVLEALRRFALAPGQYAFPWAGDQATAGTPEFQQKMSTGPVGFLVLKAPGPFGMGKPMVQSVIYYLVVSTVVAYIAGRTLAPGTEYLQVFRITATIATLGYAAALVPDAIWFGRRWSGVWKGVFDAVIYGLLTGGVFGWRWPEMAASVPV